MVSRAAVINLYYHHDSVLTQAVFDQLCDDLFAKAIAHTGVGKEGDYILWNCQGYTVGATQEASSQGSGYDVHITFTFTYLSDAAQEAEIDQAVADLLSSLDLSGKTDYQKIKAIYDYICSNITYDYDNLYDDSYTLKHSSYAALINKKAVCQGYASLFYRLALEAGIDARVISGDSSGPHAWNIVKIEGSYYNLDSTWDAGNTEYEYFLKNAKDFPNHTRDAAYTTAAFTSSYPIAATSYAVHGSIQDYEYKITNNGQVIITKYTGNDADVTTPATIADMPVIGIDKKAFFDLPNLETLTISEGVQSVSDTFTGNVPKLRQIHFPSTLDFRTPDGSDYHILGSCPSLEEITVPDNSPYLYAENGILYDSAQYTVLCSAQNADLGDLVLPENVQIINTHAFEYNTHLTSIQMPDCVYLIGYQAFESCVNLVSANIPRSLGGMGIGLYAFENTSLQSLFIPKEIEDLYITGYQFDHKALQEIKGRKRQSQLQSH
ncbi:MAG: leucine-rich repeat protein [Dorea sp.]